jgi:hypothetical protein
LIAVLDLGLVARNSAGFQERLENGLGIVEIVVNDVE